MALDNKLSNIIGTKIPQWIISQLTVRSAQNSRLDTRDNSNLIYLANKSAWVRLVSSVNITDTDLTYFKSTLNIPGISQPEDLAKKYVLYGGTSIYQNQNSYQLRSGISGIKPNSDMDGAYGMLGIDEIQKYGFRPMPGISNVVIETQGRLGSVKQAIITIKCWDKQQLDVIDALYFKLGYTMFIEWGHTYYYPSITNLRRDINEQSNTLKSTELSILDPFSPGLTKESIYRQISLNSRQSDGNYDAMLGIVTNFNFSYNQEGGYDCTLRLMSLGIAGDYIKINNPSILPGILRDEVIKLNNTITIIQPNENLVGGSPAYINNLEKLDSLFFSIYAYINSKETENSTSQERRNLNSRGYFGDLSKYEPRNAEEYINIITKYGILNSKYATDKNVKSPDLRITGGDTEIINKDKYDFVFDDIQNTGPTLYLQSFGLRIPQQNPTGYVSRITLDKEAIVNKLLGDRAYLKYRNSNSNLDEILIGASLSEYLVSENEADQQSSLYKKTFYYGPTNPTREDYDLRSPNPIIFTLELGASVELGGINSSNSIFNSTNTGIIIDGKTISFVNEQKKETSLLASIFARNPDPFAQALTTQESGFSYARQNQIKNALFQGLFQEIIKQNSSIEITSVEPEIVIGVQLTWKIVKIKIKGVFEYPVTIIKKGKNLATGAPISEYKEKKIPINWYIETSDTALIKEVIPAKNLPDNVLFSEYYKLTAESNLISQNKIEIEKKQQQKNQQNELATQVTAALSYQSALEIILRTIQVKSLNKALYQTGKPDLEIGRKVYNYKIWEDLSFVDQIFSNGIYSGIIKTLIQNPNSISNQNYKTDEDQFIVNAKYGFASTLLGSNSQNPFENLEGKEVNYTELLNSYVVPYQIDQEIVAGIKTNHPVYIPFGFLITLLNHICTLYDTKLESSAGGILGAQVNALQSVDKLLKAKQKPLIYIDYNPKLNFFLTNPQHLSTNPWVVLIPYEGYFDDYKKLFDPDVIEGNSIKPLDGSTQSTPLFNPEKDDLLSWQLPKIKDGNAYRGKLMNILLNVDYLASLIRDYSFKDGTNDVFLRPFLEQILSDVNKYLGNFNALRLAYNDTANTYQFVDDQYVPSIDNEEQIIARAKNETEQNRTEIPIVGRNSIAKSVELKTEISSRLATMLAISSNSKPEEQVQNSVNGDNFGFLNKNYIDRYIPRITSAGDEKSAKKDGEKTSSMQFNQTITDFYSRINPAYSDVSHATSFYINKMSIQKNRVAATRSSMLIPISINLSLDGVGGLTMGQAFTVSKDLLPYNYYSNNPGNLFDGYTNQVGFAIVGLSHTIDNNSWTTSIRTQMIPVKDRVEFNSQPRTLEKTEREFTFNQYNIGNTSNANWFRDQLINLGYKEKGRELANAGDISAKLASEGIALFKEIKNKYPKLVIQVTGGNDVFHLNRPNSKHKDGNGLDFILENGNDQDVANVNNLIIDFARRYQISYIDEYDASKQSKGATGNHFHIAV